MLRLICLLIIILAASCQQDPKLFNKISSEASNITFQNTISNTSQLNILNYLYFYNGAGVAAGDFNNDGLADLYFVANQNQDKLYLNKGNLEFEDVSKRANLLNENNWTTGVTTVDINNDGLLDLYICLVGAYSESKNLLYVNKGIENGIPTFENESAKYGLDISSYATQAVFFDFDLDGDLDMFLLNHSVHPNRTYGKGSARKTYSKESGDILFENREGIFV
ncbi:MAG: FG-GAP repeat domain-containing protein, partial [Flavobacteriales bacterium]